MDGISSPSPFQVPDLCPACSGPTVEEGDFLYCRSRSCPAKLSGDVRVWIRQLGLLHWGDAMVDSLTDPDKPKIRSVADLYRLEIVDIAECCSGEKMAKKCYEILHSNKSIPLELLLGSMNISGFGLSTATDIVQAGFDNVAKVLEMGYEELMSVPNIGETTARQVFEGLAARRETILDLAEVLDIRKASGGPLKGKSICITGELSMPRKAVEKMVMEAGGFPKGSVTKATSYLVTNDSGTTSSKMANAKKHGIPVINEADLMSMLGVSRDTRVT